MKLCIAGSRSFNDYELLETEIYKRYSVDQIDTVISGRARGADRLGEEFANKHHIPLDFHPVTSQDWEEFGKDAGHLRNLRMVKLCDEVIVFWDGKSPGTASTIRFAEVYNKVCHIVKVE